MWVLSTARAELHYFTDSAGIPGGYAILSHTWTQDPSGEETFRDVQGINKECKSNDDNPRDHVGEKIRQCCEIAENDGYGWIWIDSCCINKTSSTELSEAINSMFNWYALAEVCYVYLDDVSHIDNPHDESSSFQRARWHSRGWTLQELLAPAFAVFFSKEWKNIGTKYALRVPLSKCTGINVEYLTREWDFRVHPSIARRMSWAARRKTTRVEDEAYCLLGLFDISMPTLYGEGQHAFQRLQAELAKQSTDATLLTWGACHYSIDDGREQTPLNIIHTQSHHPEQPYIFLFAPSPSMFSGWSDAYPSPQILTKSQLDEKGNPLGQSHNEVPSFEATPYGMKCRFPVTEVDGITIAVLPCQENADRLGLLLHQGPNDDARIPSRQVYYISWEFRSSSASRNHEALRLACLGSDEHNLCFRGKPVVATWRDIYVMAHPPTTGRRDGAHLLHGFLPDVSPTPFRIPRVLMQTLRALGFFPRTGSVTCDPASKDAICVPCMNLGMMETVSILLGTCTKVSTDSGSPRHWAWASYRNRDTWAQPRPDYAHDCAADHIHDWPDLTRSFGDAERTIRLVFTPCTHAPERTLVLGLELSGEVYERIFASANIRLPPPIRFSHQPVDSPSRTGLAHTTSLLQIGSVSVSTSSFSEQRSASIGTPSTARPRTTSLQTSHHSSESSSASALASALRDVSITKGEHVTHSDGVLIPEANNTARMGTVSDPHNELRQASQAHNPSRDCGSQEMKEAHDDQIRKLAEAIEKQQAEFAQLRESFNNQSAVLAQVLNILHTNGLSPPPEQLEGGQPAVPSFVSPPITIPSSPSHMQDSSYCTSIGYAKGLYVFAK